MTPAAAASGAAGETVALAEGVHVTTLPSGLRVATERMPHVRSATVGWWVDVGSRDEDAGLAGATHFLEHLLFKGTQRRSAREIAEAFDAIGGDSNAFTTKEHTCFLARVLDRHVDEAIAILADMIGGARCAPEDVEAERRVILEELRQHEDLPDELCHSLWCGAHFDGHPLGREVLGTFDTVGRVSRDAIADWYARQYVPGNLVVAAAGNVAHDQVVEAVAQALGGAAGRPAPARPREAPTQPGPRRAVVQHKPIEQAHVVLGGPGLPRHDERRWAAAVLDVALGGSMASRLFQEVRERRGLAYAVGSEQQQHRDAGIFDVYAATAPERLEELLAAVRGELDAVRRDGLGREELERAKASLAGGVVMGLEDTGSRMARLGRALLAGQPFRTLDEVLARIDAVDADAVGEATEAVLGGPYTLAVVGPVDEDAADDLAAWCAA